MAYNEDSSASGHDEPWIQWFCGLKGNEMFCEVERSYIEDGFNLYGLRACVPNFSDCLDLILDRIGPDDSDDSHLTQSACTLYGLIHARYIITAHGLDAMYNKYAAKEFGVCPLVQCQGQPVLPVGLKDETGYESVKVFCPKCQCVYHPPPPRRGGSGTVDGASFGTTFAHLFLMTFNNLVPDGLPPDSVYVPRVFGFRVHQSARQRPDRSGSGQLASNNANNGRSGRGSVGATAASTIGTQATSSAIHADSTRGQARQEGGQDDKTPSIHAASKVESMTSGVGVVMGFTSNAAKNDSLEDGGGKARGEDGCGHELIEGTKRKPRVPGNTSTSVQVENNGSKQSKRQKRPTNGI
mmetsp:Transcript_34822/g.51127  ORF Transcript_34822/g.51127 Transcript_34822/m.51127 type:complete len:354 (-) Transcript_34822:497-1558(-)|eukprot:CAMPEP_0195509478 /NCGR_PEP_ID=MMETSP0794_2-20130614/2404_1 /TAXON_ID=515487 /ORGANISM="Stephanopyxis turris, Strain CCMP 815" /LENGTH=353 /DNA_ID=CAMNT_0040636707 /DNA_START=300 /DNA_END=1361 /DNA_ORIENTATION=+